MILGYLPSSNGPHALAAALSDGFSGSGTSGQACGSAGAPSAAATEAPSGGASSSSPDAAKSSAAADAGRQQPSVGSASKRGGGAGRHRGRGSATGGPSSSGGADGCKVAAFYKAWDLWGALGNFSPHEIVLPDFEPSATTSATAGNAGGGGGGGGGPARLYRSVEHYYQASKFSRATEEGRALADQVRQKGGGGKEGGGGYLPSGKKNVGIAWLTLCGRCEQGPDRSPHSCSCPCMRTPLPSMHLV